MYYEIRQKSKNMETELVTHKKPEVRTTLLSPRVLFIGNPTLLVMKDESNA